MTFNCNCRSLRPPEIDASKVIELFIYLFFLFFCIRYSGKILLQRLVRRALAKSYWGGGNSFNVCLFTVKL